MKLRWLVIPAAAALMMAGQANAAMGKDEALALAKKSGCLACHKIEAKVVGPAWQDVGKKYSAGDKATLVDKVKKGGKGNWGQVPMPPYSPRVPDADIEALVDFVLSLGK